MEDKYMKITTFFSLLLLFLAIPLVAMDAPFGSKIAIQPSGSMTVEDPEMWDLEPLDPTIDVSKFADDGVQLFPKPVNQDEASEADSQDLQSKGLIRCTECPQTFSDMQKLKDHLLATHLNYKPLKCPQCDYSAVQSSNMRTHIKRLHPKLPAKAMPKLSVEDKKIIDQKLAPYLAKLKFKCAVCPEVFETRAKLYSHGVKHYKRSNLAQQTPAPYMSEFRIETSPIPVQAQPQIQSPAASKQKMNSFVFFNCSLCSETFSSAQEIAAHNQIKHAKQKAAALADSLNKRAKQNPPDEK